MTIYDDVAKLTRRAAITFTSGGDPVEVFARAWVYVEFDRDDRDRQPVTVRIPRYAGAWVCAYSAVERLFEVCGENVEYSMVKGAQLLAITPNHAGIWLDRGYQEDSRQIVLPPTGSS